jgi:hypothetical protein
VDLSRSSVKELFFFGLIGMLFIVVALLEPYNTELASSAADAKTMAQDHLKLSERLGSAILLGAGYVKIPPISNISQIGDSPVLSLYLELKEEHPDLQCIKVNTSSHSQGNIAVDTRILTVTIVAAEQYNRAYWERRMEEELAEFTLKYRGRLPDFSLGLAQIRPSIARRILKGELEQFDLADADLLEILVNNCQNARLAAKYVESLAHQFASARNADELIAKVAQAYNGSSTQTIHGLRYVDAVMGAYHLLTTEDSLTEESEAKQTEINACAQFRIAAVAAERDVEWSGEDPDAYKKILQESAGKAEVQVYLLNADPGPSSYIERLAMLRSEWLIKKLIEYGFARERVFVEQLSVQESNKRFCQGEEDSLPSFANITVKAHKVEEQQPPPGNS